jgi:outer membrane protein assembly factor BamB
MRIQYHIRLALGIFMLGTLVSLSFAGESAQRILEQTGVKGGLVVHIGCGDGQLTAALGANDSYLVQGLDANPENVAVTRKVLQDKGLYGQATAVRLNSARMPYIDNAVNLVVAEDLGRIPMDEVMRVLVPNGVAYVKQNGKWNKTIKPWPKEIDEWTHYLHDPSNNAVAHDTVIGPPRHLQWHSGPRWLRHHDHMSSFNALVSSRGRIFYIMDEGSRSLILLPPAWKLTARDAFNGTILWKRDIGKWNESLWPLKSGPANLPRRLVAKGNTVYAPLGFDVSISAMDAATGKTLRTYENTAGTEEILLIDNMLLVVVNEVLLSADVERVTVDENAEFFSDSRVTKYPFGRKLWSQVQSSQWLESKRAVMAFRADTGEFLWKKESRIVPLTLAADIDRIYFHDGAKIIALNRKNGKEAWQSVNVPIRRIESWFAPTLVVHKNVVLFAGGENVPHSSQGWRGGDGIDTLTALDAQTGKTMWMGEHPFCGYQSPEDLVVIDDLAWAANIAKNQGDGIFQGRNLRTGNVEKVFPPTVKAHWFHHRCYRARATDKYFLASRTGTEFIDMQTGEWTINHWVRGGCLYGIMPANGMIYTPPHPCSCYGQAKTFGFNALAAASPSRKIPRDDSTATRLEKGPAYHEPTLDKEDQDDWPTYRHDAARSGHTTTNLPTALKERKPTMAVRAGMRMTPPVSAQGILLVASIDEHAVRAFNATSSERLWEFVAGGRVDSSPTIHNGRVLFGAADGYVYCLRLKNGQLCWRFRAAPVERSLVSCEQVESVWPTSGSILVENNVAYFVAGRSYFLDGGIHLYGLDPKTGQVVTHNVLNDRDPVTGENFQVRIKGLSMPTALPDILSSNGEKLFMRSQVFDLQGKREDQGIDHLFAPFGFLDQSGFHRTFWIYGSSYNGAIGGYGSGKRSIAGRILVHDQNRVFGYGREQKYFRWASAYEYQLFAADKKSAKPPALAADSKKNPKKKRPNATWTPAWAREAPFRVRTMLLAGKTLFIAGTPSVIKETEALENFESPEVQSRLVEQQDAFEGKKGSLLWAVSAEDGSKLAEYALDTAPVFDGMIAADGVLYIAMQNGTIISFAGK